jgi:hypothetical protein
MVAPGTGSKRNSNRSATALFPVITEQIWWHILPLDDSYYDDISVGIGIKWKYILSLLINSGLLFTKTVNSSQRKMLVPCNLWADLITSGQSMAFKLGFTITGTWNNMEQGKSIFSRQYFICPGVTFYNNPHPQLQGVHAGCFVYNQLCHLQGGDVIQRAVSVHADTIIQTDYLNRVAATTAAAIATHSSMNNNNQTNISNIIRLCPSAGFRTATKNEYGENN